MKKYKVLFLPLAKQDVQDIKMYYWKINPNLVKRFAAELSLYVHKIETWPQFAAVRYENIRCANLSKFPYAIHYYYDELTHNAYIIGVYHNTANPNKGSQRIAE